MVQLCRSWVGRTDSGTRSQRPAPPHPRSSARHTCSASTCARTVCYSYKVTVSPLDSSNPLQLTHAVLPPAHHSLLQLNSSHFLPLCPRPSDPHTSNASTCTPHFVTVLPLDARDSLPLCPRSSVRHTQTCHILRI